MLMDAYSRYLFWIHVYFLGEVVELSTILSATYLKGKKTSHENASLTRYSYQDMTHRFYRFAISS